MAGAGVAIDHGTFEVRSPVDGSVLATLEAMGPELVRAAVATAGEARMRWAALSPAARAERLLALARVLDDRAEEIVECVYRETGKPRAEALAGVVVCADLVRYYARITPKYFRPRRVSTGWIVWKRAWVEREPLGVVGAITPWNYPLILPMDAVVSALSGGNAVVLKPSEFTPLSGLLIAELCRDAGLPTGLVEVVTGAGDTGAALVRSGVDKISFTGSTAVGRRVMAAAAETLTPVTLELGGKDPAIVLDDADLDRAARGVAFGAFFNAGQTCISIERVYVQRSIAGEFTERVVAEARSLRTSRAGDGDVGPMITDRQRANVVDQLEDALARGARALCGGVPAPDSRIIEPTVLVDVDESMGVLRDETFGPVLPIVPIDSEDEAVERSNALGYGLFASVWTRDRARGLRVGRRLRAGGVSINDSLSHYGVAALPMGGVGESGFGRRRGVEGLDEMTKPRSILVDTGGLKREPWWFPYDERGRRLSRAVLAWRGRGGVAGLVGAIARWRGR